MRDLALTLFLLGSLPFIIRRPTYGVMLWVWVGVMSPHRLTWGFAYDMPFAMLIAIATLIGMVVSKEPKRLPVTPITVVLFVFVVWMCITTLFALDAVSAPSMLDRVIKIQFMVFIALSLLHSKQHIQTLVWVLTLSVAFFGVKGGIFTVLGGGMHRVFGPAGSFIEENNSLALATVMIIPLLWHLRILTPDRYRWLKPALVGAMVICMFSVLGSHSRGALIAIAAMLAVFWSKTRYKVIMTVAFVMLIPFAIGFMPDHWTDRMKSIQNYEEDGSAMGRINSWQMAINLANDRPLVGGGFEMYNSATFARYAPNPLDVHSAHSIYFQVLGEHGYVGLALFLLLWILVWREASWIVRHVRGREDWHWAGDMARMMQVSLAGYAVGGAFLNLAYYDVPYYIVAALLLTRQLMLKELGLDKPKGWRAARPPAKETDGEGRRPGAGPSPSLGQQLRADRSALRSASGRRT